MHEASTALTWPRAIDRLVNVASMLVLAISTGSAPVPAQVGAFHAAAQHTTYILHRPAPLLVWILRVLALLGVPDSCASISSLAKALERLYNEGDLRPEIVAPTLYHLTRSTRPTCEAFFPWRPFSWLSS